jgi:hypothetical protein
LEKENPLLKRVLQVLSLSMIGVFFGLGFFFWFTNALPELLPQPNRTILIIILFVYGSFRGYRMIKRFRED